MLDGYADFSDLRYLQESELQTYFDRAHKTQRGHHATVARRSILSDTRCLIYRVVQYGLRRWSYGCNDNGSSASDVFHRNQPFIDRDSDGRYATVQRDSQWIDEHGCQLVGIERNNLGLGLVYRTVDGRDLHDYSDQRCRYDEVGVCECFCQRNSPSCGGNQSKCGIDTDGD